MKKIEFLGAADGEVTGSSYLITSDNGGDALVDFGMFQGPEDIVKKNYDLLAFAPSALQAVFLTHAHLDHCGRLPLLVYGNFHGKIYMTPPTRSLVEITLYDSARIAEKDMSKKPLYTTDAVDKLLRMIETVEYDKPFTVGDFSVVFRDAGHILGSASIEITDISSDRRDTIVFSGDLGNTPQPIEKPTEYIDSADYVVVESTYGDSSHPDEDAKQIIQEEINAVEKDGGVLLIPAFALERTQEVLHVIHHLKKEGKVAAETPVFLDSPMGIDATHMYLEFKEYYNEEIQSHEEIPFNFQGLEITYEFRDSKDIVRAAGPKVIIAGSGMMSGGRIMQHALNYLHQPTTRVLFVGYQAEDTLGRKILEGAQNVLIEKTQVSVKAHIREIKILSSHADQPRLLKWIGHIKGLKKIFITHGEQPERVALAEKIKAEYGITDIYLPSYQEIVSLM